MNSNALTTREQTTDVSTILADVGQAANEAASQSVFADYRSRKAANTLSRQDAGLSLFSEYLAQAAGTAPTGEALATNPEAWKGITWGLVEGFAKWLLVEGYAVGTTNVRLSTVKVYAELAAKAGVLDAQTLAMIQAVTGYSRKEAKRIDERREQADIPTRQGSKKRELHSLTARREQSRIEVSPEVIRAVLADMRDELTGEDIEARRVSLKKFVAKVEMGNEEGRLWHLPSARAWFDKSLDGTPKGMRTKGGFDI